jgi:hypothetical protein
MPISIAGSGTITGISVGGIPDGVVDTDVLAANAVTTAKLGSAEQSGLCKAWVNFNGIGTVAIRASYNVSSITDNGVGLYTVNFTAALADANYSAACATSGVTVPTGVADGNRWIGSSVISTSACSITQRNSGNTLEDGPQVFVAIFR